MNGEISNFIELIEEEEKDFQPKSHSDVEIIPFLFKKYGIKFLNKLNGMFALLIIDEVENKVYLVRDRYGEKPFYYHFTNNKLYFASEVKALKTILNLEIDKINLQINFTNWFLPQPLTLYKNTFNVNPGCYLEYFNNQIQEIRWYKPEIVKSNDSEEEIAKKFINLYKDAIRIRLRSDVSVGAFLSGGLDSTSIAKFAHEYQEKFYTFSANIVGKEQFENNTDIEIPKKLSKELNFKHTVIDLNYQFYNENIVKIINNYDEIFVNSGILVFYLLAEISRKSDVPVILTGVGGDELFGGYPWQAHPRKVEKIFPVTTNKRFYSETIYKLLLKINFKLGVAYKILTDYQVWHSQSLATVIFGLDFHSTRQEIDKKLRFLSNQYFNFSKESLKYNDIYNFTNFSNVFTVLSGQNYLADIATMNFSVENRSPFLDYRVFEYMMSIPDKMKTKLGQKGLLRKILENHLPDYVTKAKKSGPTMPINLWFYEEPILSKVRKFILKNVNQLNEFLPLEVAQKIKNDDNWLFEQKSQAANLRLFAILSYLIWYKINISREITETNITFEEVITKF
jgi:asparagine synthase (glutamine-hydrolysing)